MILVIDMNLSPQWVTFFETRGIQSSHWSTVGDPRASDSEIMTWARTNNHVVLTSDLDFSALLAASGATGPSVVLLRVLDALPPSCGEAIVRVLTEHTRAIESGAFVTFDEVNARVRILPMRRDVRNQP